MTSPTFTTIDEFDRTEQLAEELYAIGVANPRTAYDACSPAPYPSRAEIASLLNTRRGLVLAYDDDTGELAGGIQFEQDSGRILTMVNRYYLAPGGAYTDKGNALVSAMFAAVKARSGSGRVISQSPNPNTVEVTQRLGAEVEPVVQP